MCQGSTFFFLAVLLLLICSPCSAAQHMNAAERMGETSGSQLGDNSPYQTASTSGFQGGGSFGPQAGGSPESGADSGSGFESVGSSESQGDGSGFQNGGNSGVFSESLTGKGQRSQTGGANSPSLNASRALRGLDDNASANGAGRGDADVDVQNWRGMASKDGESHPLRLNVETILTLDPDVARDMLSSNLSLEEIRSRLRTGNRDAVLRGSLRISNNSYRLVNITVQSSANESLLRAGLVGPSSMVSSSMYGAEAKAVIVGNISMTIFADDLEIARGYAMIKDSSYSGTYVI